MSTTTFASAQITAPVGVNTIKTGNQITADAVLLQNGNVLSVYGDTNNIYLRLISAAGVPFGAQVQANTALGTDANASSRLAQAAVLTNGHIVVTWTDGGVLPAVHYRVFDPALNPLTAVLNVVAGAQFPDVAALTNGGFVIAYQYNSTIIDHDIYASRYDSAGSLLASIPIDFSGGTLDDRPSVAGLNDGGFAIAHHRNVLSNTQIWRSVNNANGSPRFNDTLFSASGSVNHDADVLALKGGGFLVNYEDTNWAPGQNDITSSVFAASGAQLADSRATNLGPNNAIARSALSPDGLVFVASSNFSGSFIDAYGTLLSADGATVMGLDFLLDGGPGFQAYATPVWLDRTHLLITEAVASPAPGNDGSGYGVAAVVIELSRNVAGNNTGEILNFTADAFNTSITEGSGNNNIAAGAGTYFVTLNGGNNIYVGGAGSSTVFAFGGSNYLQGGTGSPSDVLVATGAGVNTFYGGSGNNYIVGGTGKNTIVGGAGALQSLYGNGSGTGVNGDYIVAGSGASNVLSEGGTGSAQLWGSLTGANYIVGNNGDDLLVGGASTNYFFGGAGNDTVYGGSGTNYIYGGFGNDFIWTNPVGTQSTGYVYEGLGGGVDTVADFTPGDGAGHDVIVISAGSGFANFSDILAKTTQVGVYSVISLSATDQVYLYNVQPFQLTANDFIFS